MANILSEIAKLDDSDLRLLNGYIVDRIKLKRQVKTMMKTQTLNLRVGVPVKFRRNDGEAFTFGVVEKVNRVKVAVKVTKGNGRTICGSRWNVPITMLEAA
jgi:hypothetical protein